MTDTQLNSILERLAAIEHRIALLEAAERQRSDVWQPTWPQYPPAVTIPDNHCRVCGIDLSQATHYVCNRSDCPNRIYCVRTHNDGTATCDTRKACGE